MMETGQALDPVTYLSRRHSDGQASGANQVPCNQARPSEECDPLSPSRQAKFQPNDDAQGQPECEDMAPLPVGGRVETRHTLWKAIFWHESATRVCVVCPGPLPAWLFSESVVTLSGCIGRMSFPFSSIRREASVTCGTPDTGNLGEDPEGGLWGCWTPVLSGLWEDLG